jgi:uncharacterized membrane protein YeiB
MGGPGKTHIQGPGLQISTNNSRITVVDCLRGFALFGLFILHMVEYFELFWHAPEWGWVHDTVFFLFGGKAYAVFSLLFGLSFFIIMDNQARRGVDFRGRFAWRLALLLALGYLHGLLYSGDILQVLALSGFLLILIYPLSTRWILAIAAACLLQPVLLTQLLSLAAGGKPGGEPLHWSLMGETFGIYASGVVLFLLAYEIRWLRLPMNWLAPCGRMSLTIYVTQSLYGVPLFYGFGLGLYQGFGQVNALLLGLALWVAQMLLAGAWIKHFHYGPFEWAWRAATYGTLAVPWRRAERSA